MSRGVKAKNLGKQSRVNKSKKRVGINPIKLLEKYKSYNSIINHSKTVARVALVIAKLIKENNPRISIKLEDVKNAALLHDIDKTLTLSKNYNYALSFCKKRNISPKKIKHAALSYEILKREGLKKYAIVARQHTFFKIITTDRPKTLLSKIIYYADKRCNESKIVLLKERLAVWNKRYKSRDLKEVNKKAKLANKEIFKLQDELLNRMGLNISQFNSKLKELRV